ncbi:unnamed protein product [Orchesella dallaii]|uniref:Uncharacterized protein n=1 Tax=Orchesella dallaii TaxID=48710 RepID=A0ABP1S085_9HEXA
MEPPCKRRCFYRLPDTFPPGMLSTLNHLWKTAEGKSGHITYPEYETRNLHSDLFIRYADHLFCETAKCPACLHLAVPPSSLETSKFVKENIKKHLCMTCVAMLFGFLIEITESEQLFNLQAFRDIEEIYESIKPFSFQSLCNASAEALSEFCSNEFIPKILKLFRVWGISVNVETGDRIEIMFKLMIHLFKICSTKHSPFTV